MKEKCILRQKKPEHVNTDKLFLGDDEMKNYKSDFDAKIKSPKLQQTPRSYASIKNITKNPKDVNIARIKDWTDYYN